jgi:hypothetical protein
MSWSLGLALISAVFGIMAGVFVLRAIAVPITPTWAMTGRTIEPVDQLQSQAGWTAGMLRAVDDAGRLNRAATVWSIGAILFGAASSIANAFNI